ncbi:MAG: phage tail tape measure protein [Anaerolineales bacterium]|nr:phage tail tape measure protein [Anaerolineales bacterium]
MPQLRDQINPQDQVTSGSQESNDQLKTMIDATPWPWSQARWVKKKEGLEAAIKETIVSVQDAVATRQKAIEDILALQEEASSQRSKIEKQQQEKLSGLQKAEDEARAELSRLQKEKIAAVNMGKTNLVKQLDIKIAIQKTLIAQKKQLKTLIKTVTGAAYDYYLLEEGSQGELAQRLFDLDNQTQRIIDCETVLASLQANVLLGLFPKFEKRLVNGKNRLQKFSIDYVFRLFLEQVSIDVNLIQLALQQRQLNKQNKITQQGFALQAAQVIAMNAIWPAINEEDGFTEDTNVICYLQNGVDIRLIPYHNVMLIGIPYGVMCQDGKWLAIDYLAIPHEIGHHLFWFKRTHESENLRQKLIKKLWEIDELKAGLATIMAQQTEGIEPEFKSLQKHQWYFRWLEEIFADAFGCRIAGPISVLSFQELLASGSPTAHESHDHVHPIPALRPFIQTELLSKMGQISEPQKDKLNESWSQWVQTHWGRWLTAASIAEQTFELDGQDSSLTGKEILKRLEPVLTIVAEQIMALIPADKHPNWTQDWDHSDTISLEKLYHLFTEGTFLKNLSPLIRTDGSDFHSIGQRDLITQITRFDPSSKLISGLDQLEQLDEWVEQMLLEGWTKEGPDGGNLGT